MSEREKVRERERERDRERKRDRERERKRETEKERDNICFGKYKKSRKKAVIVSNTRYFYF